MSIDMLNYMLLKYSVELDPINILYLLKSFNYNDDIMK